MDYVTIGNSDLRVSKVCLGCMGFGEASQGMHSWTLPLEASLEVIHQALENGINFFDTAMAYQEGTSEIFLGEAIKRFARCEDVVIATKFLPRSQQEIENGISAREHIEKCLTGSLERLGVDYIDLYILYAWDENTPIEETMEILHDCIQSKRIRYIGISNCFAWQLAKANEIAKAHGWETFISVQGHYNLIFREEEREMAPYCQEHHVTMTPYSALASGRLSRRPGETSKRLEQDTYAKGKYDQSASLDQEIIQTVAAIADERQVTMTEVALAWLIAKGAVPVVGASKKSHIEGAVKACQLQLTKEEINRLEAPYVPHPLVGMMAQKKIS